MNVKQIFIFSLVVDLIVLIASYLFKDNIFLINTQVAYFSSTFVIFATYITYKQSILKNAKLYSQSIKDDTSKSGEDESDKEARTIFQAKNFLSYISVYRLISYLALSYSILHMINSGIFDAIGYISGVSITPISILILFIAKR